MDKYQKQLELLAHLDKVCTENGLHYILCGNASLCMLEGFNPLAGNELLVTMPYNDAARFRDLINSYQDSSLYVMDITNDNMFVNWQMVFDDKNTTIFHILKDSDVNNKNIKIVINFMEVPEKRKHSREFLKIKEQLQRMRHNEIAKSLAKGLKISASNAFLTRKYTKARLKYTIKTWGEIQNYKEILVRKNKIDSVFFKEIKRVSSEGYMFNIPADPRYYDILRQKMNYKGFENTWSVKKKTNSKTIISSTVGYDEIMADPEIPQLIAEAQQCYSKYLEKIEARKEAHQQIVHLNTLVQSTFEKVAFERKLSEKAALNEMEYSQLLFNINSFNEKCTQKDIPYHIDIESEMHISEVK